MRVILAYPWTDEAGKEHEPDSTVVVKPDVGRRLIADGRARPHDSEPPDEPAPPPVASTATPTPQE